MFTYTAIPILLTHILNEQKEIQRDQTNLHLVELDLHKSSCHLWRSLEELRSYLEIYESLRVNFGNFGGSRITVGNLRGNFEKRPSAPSGV